MPHEIFPALSGDSSNQIAGGHHQQVVVAIATAKIVIGLQEPQAAHHVFAAEVGAVPNKIVAGQSKAMRDKIARSHALACHRIVHLKFR